MIVKKNTLCSLLLTFLVSSCNPFSPINETSEGLGVEGLRINRFSLEKAREAIAIDESTCFILLKQHSNNDGYIFYHGKPVGYEDPNTTEVLMKVNGDWVRFLDKERFGDGGNVQFKYISEDEKLTLITDFLIEAGNKLKMPLLETGFEIHNQTGTVATFEPKEGYMRCND